jgi:hypothetical protein
MGYDNTRVYAECAERDVIAVTTLRRNSGIRAHVRTKEPQRRYVGIADPQKADH